MQPDALGRLVQELNQHIELLSRLMLMVLTILSLWGSWIAIHAIRKWRALGLPYPWYQLLIDFCLPLWTILLMVCSLAGIRFRDGPFFVATALEL